MRVHAVMTRSSRWLLLIVLLSGATGAWAAPSVKLVASPYQNPGADDDVVVAVQASQVDGVNALDLTYAFDSSLLTPTGVFSTGYTHGFSLSSSLTTPGQVVIHLASPTALAGSGEIAWVTFHVRSGVASGTVTPISWVAANLNGGAMPCGQQGLSLVIGSGPTTIAAPRNAFGAHGSQVSVPISAAGLTGGSSFDLVMTYNPNILTAISVDQPAFAACMSINSNVATPGIVRISLYGLCSLTGSGPLAVVDFNVVGAVGSRTPLNVTRGGIDEGYYPTVLADGLFNVCGTPDADGDGYSTCAGDCDDTRAAVHPGALESCNGRDDDCNSIVDDAVRPAGLPAIQIGSVGDDSVLSWAPIATATGYDVVRGDLVSLKSHTGDFSQSVDICLGSHVPTTSIVDAAQPTANAGYWYLLRAGNCGGVGSYDGADPRQTGQRDPGIAGSPYSCP
jgi:hypothetical protein